MLMDVIHYIETLLSYHKKFSSFKLFSVYYFIFFIIIFSPLFFLQTLDTKSSSSSWSKSSITKPKSHHLDSSSSSSSAFSASSSASMIFGGAPKSAPKDLKAVVVSTRFITLSWSKPDNSKPDEVTSFSVFYKRSHSDRERVANSTVGELNIPGLQPGTQYNIRVVANNQHGSGPSSQPLVVSWPALLCGLKPLSTGTQLF